MASRETKRQKTLSSSSSSSRRCRYDVFPSFSGEDVRRNFLSHVRREFKRKGIVTFEDIGIERSESISRVLRRAIQESRVAIVVLSENYASSSWCLNELLEIMRCKEEFGLKVIPVFYEVDPSDVRKQLGDFGSAFRRICESKSEEEKVKWSQALTDVAGLAGERSLSWDDEAAMIEKISIDVSNVLNKTPSRDFEGLVGIGSHIEKLLPLLCLESDEPKIIGIWGPAGIGKTTIARALFDRLSRSFQRYDFMENIKEICERTNNDVYGLKLHLQERLLSKIFDHDDVRIHHLNVAADRLKGQNVLLVLDDVDKLEQLEALADTAQWFGPGSRVIVTTENRRILEAHGIEDIYDVSFPYRDEALEIFCRYAFGQSSPPDGFRDIAVEVTEIAGVLPLGLRVLGSSLRNMSESDWYLELPMLRTELNGDIEKILKVGFEALSRTEKSTFLYVACLFNYTSVSYVTQVLANSDLHVARGRKVLAKKSLIHLDTDEYITMHKLLVQLGREIVREESGDDPGKQKFLWDAKDIRNVFINDIGTRAVLGISLNTSELSEELVISGESFKKLSNLHILRFFKHLWDHEMKLRVSEGLVYLPSELRLIEWECYPMKTMPSKFCSEFLVRLEMPNSKLEKLWDGAQPLWRLEHMNLRGSVSLKEIPDLSKAPNLKELELSECTSLVTLTSSLRKLKNLEVLIVEECSNLKALSHDNINLESLWFLNMNFCSKLETFPGISSNIEILHMSRTAVREVPESIRDWSRLSYVDMSDCSSLETFPQFPESVEYIDLSNTAIEEIPEWIEGVPRLEALCMNSCKKLKRISASICKLQYLHILTFDKCKNISSFPSEIFKTLPDCIISSLSAIDP